MHPYHDVSTAWLNWSLDGNVGNRKNLHINSQVLALGNGKSSANDWESRLLANVVDDGVITFAQTEASHFLWESIASAGCWDLDSCADPGKQGGEEKEEEIKMTENSQSQTLTCSGLLGPYHIHLNVAHGGVEHILGVCTLFSAEANRVLRCLHREDCRQSKDGDCGPGNCHDDRYLPVQTQRSETQTQILHFGKTVQTITESCSGRAGAVLITSSSRSGSDRLLSGYHTKEKGKPSRFRVRQCPVQAVAPISISKIKKMYTSLRKCRSKLRAESERAEPRHTFFLFFPKTVCLSSDCPCAPPPSLPLLLCTQSARRDFGLWLGHRERQKLPPLVSRCNPSFSRAAGKRRFAASTYNVTRN